MNILETVEVNKSKKTKKTWCDNSAQNGLIRFINSSERFKIQIEKRNEDNSINYRRPCSPNTVNWEQFKSLI